MNPNFKKFITLLVLAVSSVSIYAAQTRLYVEDFAIKKGQTKSVRIYLDNPENVIQGLQCELHFTGGLELASPDIDLVDGRTSSYRKGFLDGSNYGRSCFKIIVTNTKQNVFEGTSGAILSFEVTTNDEFGNGPATVSLKDIRLGDRYDNSTSIRCDDSTVNVYAPKSSDEAIDPSNEGKECYIDEDLKIVTISDRIVNGFKTGLATNGFGRWIKLVMPETSPLREGVTYAGSEIGGVLSGSTQNPTLTLSPAQYYEESGSELSTGITVYESTSEDFMFTPNEVVQVSGYYVVENGQPGLTSYTHLIGHGDKVLSICNDLNPGSLKESNAATNTFIPYDVVATTQLKVAWDSTDGGLKVAPCGTSNYKDYVLYPLKSPQIATGIDDVTTTSQVANVKYINLAGMQSSTPFEGVNIVVTTNADGSTTTSKMVK